jgi:hypothetical protein
MYFELWSFLSFGRPGVTTAAGYGSSPEEFRREVAQRRQRDAGAAPNLVTTPEKFRALIAAQRAEREAAAVQPATGPQVTPEEWRAMLAVRRRAATTAKA